MLSPLVRFLISHGASAFSTGVHLVIFAWVALVELGLSSSQLGWLQACVLFPNLTLMLVAGAWADRYDPARLLAAAQLLLSTAYLGLFVLLWTESGSFINLMLYGVLVGIGNAFVQPVREKLVTTIQAHSIQRRVSLLSTTQFSLQSVGIALAALSEVFGIGILVALQAGVSLSASLLFLTLGKKEKTERAHSQSRVLDDIRLAVAYVYKSTGLRQLMALIAFNGYMHMGVFLVLIPMVATQVYDCSPSEYAGLQLLFVLGMIAAHVSLLRSSTVQHPGQGALFSLLYTALVGFGLAKSPTPFGFYSLVFVWGLVAGNSAGRCRLVLQSLAEPKMQGRVMSVYQLMLFGAAPLGALVTGYVMNYMSHGRIFVFMSVSSITLFFAFMFSRTLWGVEQREKDSEQT